jgi:hypothetical protein
VSDQLNHPTPSDYFPSIDHLPGVEYLPPVELRRRPFGIGVLAVGAGTDAAVRAGERLAVAMAAHSAGYFLLDVVEVDMVEVEGPGDGGRVDDVLARLAVMAQRTDAGAFFVRGPVDRTLLAPIADEVRMVIRDAEGSFTAMSTTDEESAE